jgi:hypothetical protein
MKHSMMRLMLAKKLDAMTIDAKKLAEALRDAAEDWDSDGSTGLPGALLREVARAVQRANEGAEPAAQPQPHPAAVPDVVREALTMARGCLPRGEVKDRVRDAIVALAALDAAPAENVLGYSVIKDGIVVGTWRREQQALAEMWLQSAKPGCRLVKLVAVDKP